MNENSVIGASDSEHAHIPEHMLAGRIQIAAEGQHFFGQIADRVQSN